MSAEVWDALAVKTEEWASKVAFLPPGDMPESITNLHGRALEYRLTAESIRMAARTGKPHCPCTDPPHEIVSKR